MAIKGIHVFNQRDSAFRDDDVLQEKRDHPRGEVFFADKQ